MIKSMCQLTLAGVVAFWALQVSAAENRCGWYQMPTPGNLWLTDRDATWSITSQGEAAGPDAVDAEKAPDFDGRQFVETNVPGAGYGYGCACMRVDTDAKAQRITKVYSGKIRPLSACRNDKSLPAPQD
ncbi:Protein of unknown function [Xaviernesmea oryzae]|uniref:DUF4087 domain-containing protein n=1 Tax=Xaviernesmea oryzae TaxID=464029 RepID=A0A1X7CTV3_9HYPH|nr:DUF4087 domain-containing protein [Xaviernesmea oryzae]SMF02533.1 Protein of unknown function [Xaviernesmea oryzae]